MDQLTEQSTNKAIDLLANQLTKRFTGQSTNKAIDLLANQLTNQAASQPPTQPTHNQTQITPTPNHTTTSLSPLSIARRTLLGLHVERAGGLVEQQDAGPPDDGAGQADPLLLPAAQRYRALADAVGRVFVVDVCVRESGRRCVLF